ncbi:MAG: hypothetical protein ACRD1K_05035 [Acidimicrobiales bacterium]
MAARAFRILQHSSSQARYDRDEWQPHGWADLDGDGCNTRSEVLMAESKVPTSARSRCTVVAGEWVDPYTARSTTSAARLQIDHLVALADAYHH